MKHVTSCFNRSTMHLSEGQLKSLCKRVAEDEESPTKWIKVVSGLDEMLLQIDRARRKKQQQLEREQQQAKLQIDRARRKKQQQLEREQQQAKQKAANQKAARLNNSRPHRDQQYVPYPAQYVVPQQQQLGMPHQHALMSAPTNNVYMALQTQETVLQRQNLVGQNLPMDAYACQQSAGMISPLQYHPIDTLNSSAAGLSLPPFPPPFPPSSSAQTT